MHPRLLVLQISSVRSNDKLDRRHCRIQCVFIIGSNTFECTRLLVAGYAGKARVQSSSMRPRYTPTGKQADLYLQFRSGTDVALMNGMMQELIRNGWENKEFIQNRCNGFDDLKKEVMKDDYSLENVSKITGVPAEKIKTAAEWFAKSGASAILYLWVSPSTPPELTMSSPVETCRC